MAFSSEEISTICTLYREAKDKKRQISILAELNATTEGKICEVLKAQGYGLPGDMPPVPKSTPGRKRYAPEVREAALRDMAAGIRVADAAAKHGIRQDTASQWKYLAKKSGAFARMEKEHREKQPAAPSIKEATSPKMAPKQDWVKSFADSFVRIGELLPPTSQEVDAIDSYLNRLSVFVAGMEYAQMIIGQSVLNGATPGWRVKGDG